MFETTISNSLLLILVVTLRAMTPFRLEGGEQRWGKHTSSSSLRL
jgi:hypothetical protein